MSEPTVADLLAFLRAMPHNASWFATIADIEEILPKVVERKAANVSGAKVEWTVGYTPAELLQRACGRPKGWKSQEPRWAAVGDLFQIGSTSATILCENLGIDPHEKLAPGDED